MEGVIPEDMVNECTKRRQELIGIIMRQYDYNFAFSIFMAPFVAGI